MSELSIRLRPMAAGDLSMLRRFAVEPGLAGPNWGGFRDAEAPARQFAAHGFLSPDDSRLAVVVDGQHATAGMVGWSAKSYGREGRCWEIGIALLPEWRGQGIGTRVQEMVCEYLFAHTPVERIQAITQLDNPAEQKALTKAGFQREGVIRHAEFRAGAWHDCVLYSRLRAD